MSNFDCTWSAYHQVLQNEEIAREKALAVLDILCSPAMAKARARWLKEALERSMKVQSNTSVGTASKVYSKRSK